VYCRKIYNLFVGVLEKVAFVELYWPLSQRVHTHKVFIFSSKVKQNCQHFWKEQKQASFKSFSRVSSITSALVVLQSFVARTLWQKSYIFWSVTVYKKNPEIQFYSSNRTSARQNHLLFSVKEKIFLEIILIDFFCK
jgi:hypothetical protein